MEMGAIKMTIIIEVETSLPTAITLALLGRMRTTMMEKVGVQDTMHLS